MIIEDFEEGTLPVNKIIHGNALDVLRELPSDSVIGKVFNVSVNSNVGKAIIGLAVTYILITLEVM